MRKSQKIRGMKVKGKGTKKDSERILRKGGRVETGEVSVPSITCCEHSRVCAREKKTEEAAMDVKIIGSFPFVLC